MMGAEKTRHSHCPLAIPLLHEERAIKPEAGKHLRSMYSSGGGVTAVFTSKVDDYVAARPPYPQQLFAFFSDVVGIKKGTRVVDVGAGTGLFTAGLLDHGYDVLAIEPNEGMRRAADARSFSVS